MTQTKVYQRNLIEEIVGYRSTSENQIYEVKPVEDKKYEDFHRYDRILDVLREQAIYHLSISVRSGKGKTKKLSPESLNLSKAQADALRANAGKLGSIQVFKPIEPISYKIHYQRANIMRKTVELGGVPVIPESEIEEVQKQIRELKELVEQSKKEISEQYSLGFRDFLYRVTNIINESNVPDHLYSGILEEYARSFPSLGEILDQMHIIINGPYRIPSLLEDEHHDQNFIAMEMRTNMLNDVQSSFKSLKDSIFASLLDSLADIEAKASEDEVASRREARKLLTKVEKLVSKSDSLIENIILGDDTQDLSTLKDLIKEIDYCTDKKTIQDSVDRIRNQFELKVKPYQKEKTFEESIMENLDLSF